MPFAVISVGEVGFVESNALNAIISVIDPIDDVLGTKGLGPHIFRRNTKLNVFVDHFLSIGFLGEISLVGHFD